MRRYAIATLWFVFAATLAALAVVAMLHFVPVATRAHWRSSSGEFIVGLQSMSLRETQEVYDCLKVSVRGIYHMSRGRYLKLGRGVS